MEALSKTREILYNENEISTYENKLKDSSLIQTFPNPAINFIEIKGTIEYDEIEIIDIL